MKLHGLEITGMGPYPDRVEIDFDRLDEAGVYLLTGPTGSGKTTILDAISYALFAEIPRAAKGAEVVSDHRELTTTPSVRLEATVGGERLRVTRVPEHERPKTRGEGTTTEAQSVTVEAHRDGEWRDLTGNWSEGNAELERRVGMSSDQFSQVVMLPQGEFARFLRASVRERQELLERLFPGTDLAWLEAWLKARAESDRKAREQKIREIEDCFTRVRPIAATLVAEDEEPLPNLAEAEPALAWVEETRLTLEGIHAERAEALAVATAAAEAAATELRRLRDRVELVRRRGDAEARQAKLAERSKWRRAIGGEVATAEKAAGVLALTRTAEQQRGSADRAAAERDRLENQIDENPMVRGIEPEDRAARERELRDELNTLHNFERDELPKRRGLSAKATKLTAELKQLDEGGPESPVGRADAALSSAESLADGSKRKWLEIREARNRTMAAELAMSLKEGEPCAVCGSTEHPSPAHGDLLQFTVEDEKRAEREAADAEAAAGRARDELARIKSEASDRRARIETEITGCQTELNGLKGQEEELAAGATTIGERKDLIERAVELISGLITATRAAAEAETAAGRAAAEATREAIERGFDSVEEAMAAAREESDLATLRSQVSQHDQALAMVEGELEQLVEVDAAEQIELGPAEAKARESARDREAKSSLAGVASNNLETFRRETGPARRLYEELAPLREKAATSTELDRLASGKNERRMKLSIFVLATRLRQVIDAANHHLQRMSNQRYELLYSGDRRGNGMAGLGIEVADAYTSETRPTTTLSGGESFYASLALALGLAEIVQQESGGKKLETLFIDEGFGTLDAKSLDQVMDVIDSLREGGRSVGLVSHVEELRNRIPAQIQVEGGRDGSTLRVTAA